jgi:hypothetical protein
MSLFWETEMSCKCIKTPLNVARHVATLNLRQCAQMSIWPRPEYAICTNRPTSAKRKVALHFCTPTTKGAQCHEASTWRLWFFHHERSYRYSSSPPCSNSKRHLTGGKRPRTYPKCPRHLATLDFPRMPQMPIWMSRHLRRGQSLTHKTLCCTVEPHMEAISVKPL